MDKSTTEPGIARKVVPALSCILVIVAGLIIIGPAPTFLALPWSPGDTDEARVGVPTDAVPRCLEPKFMAVECPPLPYDEQLRQAYDSRFANYDNVTVEVRKDGSLRVLGEPMAMDGFKSLLDTQLRAQQRTVVTIRPDENCPFRHVGSVIALCNEIGVLHQTQPKPASATAGLPPGGPA